MFGAIYFQVGILGLGFLLMCAVMVLEEYPESRVGVWLGRLLGGAR